MDSLVDNVTGYVEARIELMRIEIKEEIAKGLAKALVTVVMIAVFTLFVLLISVAAAYKIGESIGMFGGYASVAIFYLFVGMLVFFVPKFHYGRLREAIGRKNEEKEIMGMNLPESNDPKEALLRKSAMHRHELEEEVKVISERTERIITNALIIGGTLAVAYFLVRQFSGSSSGKKTNEKKVVSNAEKSESGESAEANSTPGIVSQIGTALASHATVFLLTIAKEKLSEYLKSQIEKGKFQ